MNTFTITQDHLKLLRRAYVSWEDCEFGAPCIDCKRPYGNSYVEGDIAEILGWSVGEELSFQQLEKASELHQETQTVLQIILSNLPDLSGKYVQKKEYFDTSWRPAK
jgi:hypothetical protein